MHTVEHHSILHGQMHVKSLSVGSLPVNQKSASIPFVQVKHIYISLQSKTVQYTPAGQHRVNLMLKLYIKINCGG